MSKFELTTNVKYEDKMVYDYSKKNININEIEPIPNNNKKINMTFYNGSSEPNIIYTQNGSNTSYYHRRAYVYKLIHTNIDGVTDAGGILGELVIEHTPIGDNSNKLYVCFLLKASSLNTTTDIDKMIAFKQQSALTTTGIELNTVIPKQDKCIIYSSTNNNIPNKVIVFVTPIEINKASQQLINSFTTNNDLFGIYNAKYSVLPATNISKLGAEEIYIDCSPTGVSSDEVTSYSIPINSRLASEKEETTTMQTMTNFAIFTMFSLALVFIIPGLYQASVIKTAVLATNSTLKMHTIDLIITLLFFIAILVCFVWGFSSELYAAVTMGAALLFVLVSSTCILYVKKSDPAYLTIKDKKITYPENPDNDIMFDWDEFINTLFGMIKYVFGKNAIAVNITGILIWLVATLILWLSGGVSTAVAWTLFGVGGCVLSPIILTSLTYTVEINKMVKTNTA